MDQVLGFKPDELDFDAMAIKPAQPEILPTPRVSADNVWSQLNAGDQIPVAEMTPTNSAVDLPKNPAPQISDPTADPEKLGLNAPQRDAQHIALSGDSLAGMRPGVMPSANEGLFGSVLNTVSNEIRGINNMLQGPQQQMAMNGPPPPAPTGLAFG